MAEAAVAGEDTDDLGTEVGEEAWEDGQISAEES